MINILKAEILKNRHSRIVWVTFVAFALAPIMGGVFIIILKNPHLIAKAGILQSKAAVANFNSDWRSYIMLLTQAVGVGGILVFGFVASWIFGHEFSDGTSKDMLALPTSRSAILNAKFITYMIWCLTLAVSNLLVGLVIGVMLSLSGWGDTDIVSFLSAYLTTTFLTTLIGTPVAFFAIVGEGYLAPLGFVALALVLAQIIAATGFGYYFPWSIPGLYSGASGEFKEQLNAISYLILFLTSLTGYLAAKFWWIRADQAK